MIIVIDTREQNPWSFRKSEHIEGTVKNKLNVGDYSIQGYESKIAIERKSAVDLFGTLGKGHKRFQRELERAEGMDYFAILVENTLTQIRNKDFENSHYTRMKGFVIAQICFTLKMKYGIDVVFCNGRKDAAGYVREVFKAYMKLQK